MDEVKQAFSKVKQDIFSLGNELQQIKLEMADLKTEIKLISSFMDDLKLKLTQQTGITSKTIPTQEQKIPTNQQITPTHQVIPTDIPTDKLLSQLLKRQNTQVSIGNEGVPTNKQTDKPTNQHIIQHIKTEENALEKASIILDNLDALKKEIRLKFKALTSQEIAVFSLIYSLEQEGNEADYPLLASKLNLSEASIRDYIFKIIKKGIPIYKEKLNNKRVILHISSDLRKIASLETILKLREI